MKRKLIEIFLPWRVVRELEREIHYLQGEARHYKQRVDELLDDHVRLLRMVPTRDSKGRFVSRWK